MIEVKVTETHIRNGVKGDAGCCAIALALQEKFPGKSIEVDGESACVGDDRFCLPAEAEAFIINFDAGTPVDPIEFKMEKYYEEYD